jgi:hypothetical protein
VGYTLGCWMSPEVAGKGLMGKEVVENRGRDSRSRSRSVSRWGGDSRGCWELKEDGGGRQEMGVL